MNMNETSNLQAENNAAVEYVVTVLEGVTVYEEADDIVIVL